MTPGASPRRLVALSLLVHCAAACGEEAPPPRPQPSSAQVRTAFGLGDGSCWRYRFTSQGASLFATVTVRGPDATVIAGKKVFIRSFSLDSGGRPDIQYLDAETNGEVLLRRFDTSDANQRVTYRYDATAPVFARFDLDASGQVRLRDERLETDTTPTDGALERHVWTSLPDETVMTPDGPATSKKLEYRLTRGQGAPKVALYNLVPGQGIARFVDFDGTAYQVCAQRVCDGDGQCTGAPSCAELQCGL
jgi:hypothetical protein